MNPVFQGNGRPCRINVLNEQGADGAPISPGAMDASDGGVSPSHAANGPLGRAGTLTARRPVLKARSARQTIGTHLCTGRERAALSTTRPSFQNAVFIRSDLRWKRLFNRSHAHKRDITTACGEKSRYAEDFYSRRDVCRHKSKTRLIQSGSVPPALVGAASLETRQRAKTGAYT